MSSITKEDVFMGFLIFLLFVAFIAGFVLSEVLL